jgi:short-subunit dehydrogenase
VDVRGTTVLITGASSGIGRALARAFAREDCRLILTARSRERLDAVAAEVAPAEATVIQADLCQPASLAVLAAEARRRYSAIDILVNNAGVGLYAPSYEAPPGRVRQLIELNLLAPLELTRQIIPAIPRGGTIVNISSIAGKVPLPWMTVYTASKYALNAYSDGLRMELAGAGIHVLCVCPGYVDTSFRENVLIGKIPEKVAGQRRFVITAEQCAEATLDGLRRGKRTVVTPRIGWLLVVLARLLPGVLHERLGRMNPHGAAPGVESR